jgi:asparagine synthase (glutamine-hydrolysing)
VCGIAGVAAIDFAAPYVEAAEAMAAAMAHRGPDSSGVECLGSYMLAYQSLAIIDLSERGRQPMCNDDRSLCITYNGEIYNAAELRKLLLQRWCEVMKVVA